MEKSGGPFWGRSIQRETAACSSMPGKHSDSGRLMYNDLCREGFMRFCVCAIAILALAGGLYADDLDDHYKALKDAQTKKDADAVKKLAVESSKLARAEEASKKPAEMSDADWKQRLDFAKEVDLFAEYSLASLAGADSAHVKELTEALLEINPKSQYLPLCASSYLEELGKEGTEKQLAGAQKILTGEPNSEDALEILASGYASSNPERAGTYATRLIAVMKGKAKPEGVTEADWERRKAAMLGDGYYIAGAAACTRSTWNDCDRDLKAALPYIGKDQRTLGIAYFYLGLADYQIGKATGDRTKIQDGAKYSQQSAAIAGPMQQRAQANATAMRAELAAPRR